MSFADFWEGEILDHLFSIGAYVAPTVYVGLSTADPLDNATGLAEPSDAAYVRIACAAWTRVAGLVDNNAAVTFAEATEAWGTITHVALFDAESAGNMLVSFALDAGIAVDTGETARFPAGDLNVTLG